MLHFHDLEGGGIAEDKRMINAKSPWTLAHMAMSVLQSFYNNPAVPPSMKSKLKTAMMMKPSLKKKLKGGLAGVSKASGFIQRMMAENKKKHGTYKKPTDPAHKDSTMSQWRAFDYKKLANSDQGGEGEADYGASPFIQKYFKKGTVPFTKGNTAKETDKQKEARLTTMAKRLTKLAKRLAQEQPTNKVAQEEVQEAREAVEEKREEPAPVETPAELLEHFGNVGEPLKGLEVKAKVAEEATPADPAPKKKIKIKIKKEVEPEEEPKNEIVSTVEPTSVLSDYILDNRIWAVYVCFWMRFIKKWKKVQFSVYDWVQPFEHLTYSHGGFYGTVSRQVPIDIYQGERKNMNKDYLMKWAGYKESDLAEFSLRSYPDVKFFKPTVSDAEIEKRQSAVDDKKDLMGWSEVFWMLGMLKDQGHTLTMADAPFHYFPTDGEYSDDTRTARGMRIILTSPEGTSWEVTSCFTTVGGYNGKPWADAREVVMTDGKWEFPTEKKSDDTPYLATHIAKLFGKTDPNRNRKDMTEFYKEYVYPKAEEYDIGLDDNIFAELEPDDGGDRDAMKVILEYVKGAIDTKEKLEAQPTKTKRVKKDIGSREKNIKAILQKTPKASLSAIAEALKELGDTGAGGKALSAGTLSPIVKKIKESLSGDGHPRMCGV